MDAKTTLTNDFVTANSHQEKFDELRTRIVNYFSDFSKSDQAQGWLFEAFGYKNRISDVFKISFENDQKSDPLNKKETQKIRVYVQVNGDITFILNEGKRQHPNHTKSLDFSGKSSGAMFLAIYNEIRAFASSHKCNLSDRLALHNREWFQNQPQPHK